MSDKILLQIDGLEKTFPGVRALKGVDLKVRPGEVHALMGENGAGKSTLIKVLTGIHERDGGNITFDGKTVSVNSPKEAEEIGISTIYQELNLVPYQSVYENLFLGREPRNKFKNIDRKKMIKDAEKTLSDLGVNIDVRKPLKTYSTAIQQMVAIARATTVQAKLVIMDEPTSSLDAKEVKVLFDIIKKLKSRNIAVIFISHRLDEIYEICDMMTIFKDGEYVGEYKTSELSQLKLISLMIGRDSVNLDRQKQGYYLEDKEEIVSMTNIKQGMRLNGIDIDIKQGEVLGLAGLLGSGRTELAKILFGEEKADEGEIYWWKKPISFKSPQQAIEVGMGFCTEDRKVEGIFPNLSVKENITMALLPEITKFGLVSDKKQDEVVEKYIELLKIKTPSKEQKIRNLSGGNQQKVLLARWLCTNPKLLIIDEPTRGIDIGSKEEIETIIQNLASQGISVLMISSELAELERNCDRVIVMREGKKMTELIGDKVSEDSIMEAIANGGNI